MKARTVKKIRIAGIILIILAIGMGWYSFQDSITFNGKELSAILSFLAGLYLTLGSKESFESWGWDTHKFDDSDLRF